MTTKFNIGDEVFIKATVEGIYVCRGDEKDVIKYKLDIDNSIGMDMCGRAVAAEKCLLSANNEERALIDKFNSQ